MVIVYNTSRISLTAVTASLIVIGLVRRRIFYRGARRRTGTLLLKRTTRVIPIAVFARAGIAGASSGPF